MKEDCSLRQGTSTQSCPDACLFILPGYKSVMFMDARLAAYPLALICILPLLSTQFVINFWGEQSCLCSQFISSFYA